MLAAFALRFFIIFSLGVLAFISFLVATTLIWLMWFDTWRCGMCLSYPVGIYTLALLGLLILGSIAFEAGEAAVIWQEWAVCLAQMVHRQLDGATRGRDRHPGNSSGSQLVLYRGVVVQLVVQSVVEHATATSWLE